MAGTCQNCGAQVTTDYARVFSPPDLPRLTVRACPQCPDMVREGDGTPREARSGKKIPPR